MSFSLLPCLPMNFIAVIWPVCFRRPLNTWWQGGVQAFGWQTCRRARCLRQGSLLERLRQAAGTCLAEGPFADQVELVVVLHGGVGVDQRADAGFSAPVRIAASQPLHGCAPGDARATDASRKHQQAHWLHHPPLSQTTHVRLPISNPAGFQGPRRRASSRSQLIQRARPQ